MSRYLSRARVRSCRPLAAAAMAAVACAAGTGVATPAPAQASLTINLQFTGGATTMLIGGDQTNTSIPIQVWATVAGTSSLSPVPAGGTSTTAAVTVGDFDGLQFTYYNILNSNSTGTLISGGISSVALNSTLGFNGNGSQVGAIQNVSNGISVGSNTSVGSIAKPRASSPVFDNFARFNSTTGTYNVYGGDGTNIRINSPTSASFLLETVNFKPTAYAALTKTTFSVSVPSTALLQVNNIYTQANWFEDTTNQSNGAMNNQPTPTGSSIDGTPLAGSKAVIEDTLAGDTNLDGTVNFTDLTTLLQNFNTNTNLFARGDFNGDGVVNFSDLTALLQNFNLTVGALTPSFVMADPAAIASPQVRAALAPYGITAVPEPTAAAAALAALAVLARRRNRRPPA